MKSVQQETQAIYLEGAHVSAVAEERWCSPTSSIVNFKLLNFDLHRDVMESSLSVDNAIVLVGLKTANTHLVRNDPEFRCWRTISVDWKRVFRNFRTHEHQSLA